MLSVDASPRWLGRTAAGPCCTVNWRRLRSFGGERGAADAVGVGLAHLSLSFTHTRTYTRSLSLLDSLSRSLGLLDRAQGTEAARRRYANSWRSRHRATLACALALLEEGEMCARGCGLVHVGRTRALKMVLQLAEATTTTAAPRVGPLITAAAATTISSAP